MIDADLARTTINQHVGRIRRMFRWASSEELLTVTTYQALASVQGLQRGRTKARESSPVSAVPDETINATLPAMPRVVADMIRFQRLVGCRPGEVCILRPCDLNRAGDVWVYQPGSHKTQHHARSRVIFIGPARWKVRRNVRW